MKLTATWALLVTALCCVTAISGAQTTAPVREESLAGVYESISETEAIPGGRKNQGSPALISARVPQASSPVDAQTDAPEDPYNLCQSIGPFRMMAEPSAKIELVPSSGGLVMLFEDIAHGYMRTLYLNATHPAEPVVRYAFQGDSIAHWMGDTLIVDTTGFNNRTWLNGNARASEALHLLEQIRPILGGRYLEYKMTAQDTKVLARPYSYTRYFRRINTEIQEDHCEIRSNWKPSFSP